MSLRDRLMGDAKNRLVLLVAAGIGTLLLASITATILLCGDIHRRRAQLIIQTVIGATPARVAAEHGLEVLVVLLGGTAGGIWLGWAMLDLARHSSVLVVDANPSRLLDVPSSAIALLIVSSVMPLIVATGYAFLAVLPRRGSSVHALRYVSGAGHKSRFALASIGFATSFALFVLVSGLWLRFRELARSRSGFVTSNIHVAKLSRPRSVLLPLTKDESVAFMRRYVELLRQRPGIEEVALASDSPNEGNKFTSTIREIGEARVGIIAVTPNYFRVLGIAVVRGQLFDDDIVSKIPSLVIDERIANHLGGLDHALNRELYITDLGMTARVTAVVRNTGQAGPLQPNKMQMYIPYSTLGLPWMSVLVRSNLVDALSTLNSVAAVLDPSQRVHEYSTLSSKLSSYIDTSRFYLRLLAVSAALSVIVAAFGLFSVVSLSVQLSIRDLAIRASLGAGPLRLWSNIMRDALGIVGVGLIVGAIAAVGARQILRSILVITAGQTSIAIAASAVLLTIVAFLATSIPARRVYTLHLANLLGARPQ